MDYLSWNAALSQHFFNERHSHKRLFLYTSEDLLNKLGPGLTDFVDAVKHGYGLSRNLTPWERAVRWIRAGWRRLPDLPTEGYPPYVAYLALFVLAAGHGEEEEFDPHAYYARLNDLLGVDYPNASTQDFSELPPVWEDLEAWTVEDKRGELGIFRAQVVGGMKYVGYPRAQLLLNEVEREVVERVFVTAGLMPQARIAAEELAPLVIEHGKGKLRRITNRRLRRQSGVNPDATRALHELLEELLDSWDGEGEPLRRDSTSTRVTRNGDIRLALTINRNTAPPTLKFHLRARTPVSLPEGGSHFAGPEIEFVCTPFFKGWSEPLLSAAGPVDGTLFDWEDTAEFQSRNGDWTLKMNGRSLRIFVSSEEAGFAGPWYAEPDRVLPGMKALIATKDEQFECYGLDSVNVDGLPPGWHLYKASAGMSRQTIHDLLGYRSPMRLRINFQGGIPHGRRTFFRFAIPRIIVEHEDPDQLSVEANGVELPRIAIEEERSVYSLADGLDGEVKGIVTIRARSRDEETRREIYFHDQIEWPPQWTYHRVNRFGLISQNGLISGAQVSVSDVKYDRAYPLLSRFSERRVFLIGRKPGEIVKWPQEELPKWEVVWAVPIEREGIAYFVAEREEDISPSSTKRRPSKSKLRLWCEVLFYWRRRIAPPEHRRWARLWKEYIEAARNACCQ